MITRRRFVKAVQELIDDPKAARERVRAKVKREHPEMTDEENDDRIGVLRYTFGI